MRYSFDFPMILVSFLTLLVVTGCGDSVDPDPGEPNGQSEWSFDESVSECLERGDCLGMVSAGTGHVCILASGGGLECYGANADGQSDAPDGEFLRVSAGRDHTCAIEEERELDCWGLDEGGFGALGQTDPPEGTFDHVASGSRFACALATNGGSRCWGNNPSPVQRFPDDIEFEYFDIDQSGACGIDPEGSLHCWGEDAETGRNDAPEGEFDTVSAAVGHACGIDRDGKIDCWGGDDMAFYCDGPGCPTYDRMDFGQLDSPEGTFTEIAVGTYHSCALDERGDAHCWGSDERDSDEDEITETPDGQFVDLASGSDYACGLRADDSLECWGAGVPSGLP